MICFSWLQGIFFSWGLFVSLIPFKMYVYISYFQRDHKWIEGSKSGLQWKKSIFNWNRKFKFIGILFVFKHKLRSFDFYLYFSY